ncbi:four helix bundle protein, partial [Patescibacteria group bacterium]|nr:four helix bundle protein [Patescibacteria group bacterium]
LDILEDIVEARYTRERRAILRRLNLRLEKMRVLLRLCHERRFLPTQGYEHGFRLLAESGRMVGGWMRSLQGPEGKGRTPPSEAEAR